MARLTCLLRQTLYILKKNSEYRQAAKKWGEAYYLSKKRINKKWSELRIKFCLKQIGREKLKEM